MNISGRKKQGIDRGIVYDILSERGVRLEVRRPDGLKSYEARRVNDGKDDLFGEDRIVLVDLWRR